QAIVWATAQVGTYYRWGGTCTDPRLPGDIPAGQRDGNNSWVHNCDCSSLLRAAYEYAGVTIGGYTGDQVRDGLQVSLDDVQPGDLTLSASMQAPGVPSHVVMYIGSGQYVHSPATGRTVEISDSGWYLMPENVSQVRRVAGAGEAPPLPPPPMPSCGSGARPARPPPASWPREGWRATVPAGGWRP